MAFRGPAALAILCLFTFVYTAKGINFERYKEVMEMATSARSENEDLSDANPKKKAVQELVIFLYHMVTGRGYSIGQATGLFSGKRKKRFVGLGTSSRNLYSSSWGSSGSNTYDPWDNSGWNNDPWQSGYGGNRGGSYGSNNNNNRYGGGNTYGGSSGGYNTNQGYNNNNQGYGSTNQGYGSTNQGYGGNQGGGYSNNNNNNNNNYGWDGGYNQGGGYGTNNNRGSGYNSFGDLGSSGYNNNNNFNKNNNIKDQPKPLILHCPVQANQSSVYALNSSDVGYPATAIGNELFFRSLPGSDLFFFFLARLAVVPGTPPIISVDQNFVTANMTCPTTDLTLFSYTYQNTLVGGRCWIVQGFGEFVRFSVCQTKSCVNCKLEGHEKNDGYSRWNTNQYHPNDYNHGHNRNVTVNQCVTEYRVVQVISYCENLPLNSRVIFDRIVIPLFCTCKSVDCQRQEQNSYGSHNNNNNHHYDNNHGRY